MTSKVLTLREYEKAEIGPTWDATSKIVTDRDVSLLERLQQRTGQEIFEIGRRSIKARNYVGTISLGDRVIEVLPKTDLNNDQTRQRFLEMLAITQLIPFREVDIAAQAKRFSTLLDAFMCVYLSHLTTQWRRGRISNYRKVDANRNCLKGKLLFGENLRKNVAHAERFYTRSDAFTVDVPLSQTLKLATHVCRRHAVQHAIQQDALSLLMEFDEVSDVRLSLHQLSLIHTDRQTDRFASVLTLGKSLILGESPDRTATTSTFSLMFDMNVVFEQYIAQLMKRAMVSEDRHASAQIGGKHLLSRNGKGKFRLIPDIGIYENRKLICLVDTKWKLLDRSKSHDGVSQADMYQMYAYAREFQCSRVIVLFPATNNISERIATYQLDEIDGVLREIEVWTIDVGETNWTTVSELRNLVFQTR